MDDYIRREDAVIQLSHNKRRGDDEWELAVESDMNIIRKLPSADAIPYSIESDGTLTITVPKGTYKNINRVLVEEDGTHWGGLYYAD